MNEKSDLRTALFFGGAGFEHDISVKSAENLQRELNETGIEILPVLIAKDGNFYISEKREATVGEIAYGNSPRASVFPIRLGRRCGLITEENGFIEISAAIPLLHGDFGEDGRIQGLLEALRIPYVGCDTVSGAICSDKAYTKLIAESVGVPTVRGVSLSPKSDADSAIIQAEMRIGYPVFVKPSRLGSSVGASVANDRRELIRALNEALSLGNGFAVIEDYIKGARELECAFFELKGKQYFTNIGEIRCESGFYDYENKYSKASQVELFTKADVTDDLSERIRQYSARLVCALGCRDLSRIDFFLSENGKLYFNEINTMPGLTAASMFPRLARNCGFSLSSLFLGFLDSARERAL